MSGRCRQKRRYRRSYDLAQGPPAARGVGPQLREDVARNPQRNGHRGLGDRRRRHARPPEPPRGSDRLAAAIGQNRATKRQPLPPCWSPARATPAPPSPARLFAPVSIASCDIIVLLLATQIKYKSGTPVQNGPVKAEVTFFVQGVSTPPCGVPRLFLLPPSIRRLPSPSRSSIGAFSHSLISRSTAPSATRRATDLRRSSCGIESNEPDKTASTTSVKPRHKGRSPS